ncbi:Smr/MutS family protein [uncultured Desulfovibrio sp.]|uniref:Smr/MutS family protein n=1 Tax=uncultured Desulfovibrio sp. TaxID=167968 RepID=UPI0026196C04|nr:Smr/MutS family protein [uncultured Desulfovibrio sp.]
MSRQPKEKHPDRLWCDEDRPGDNPFAALDQNLFPRANGAPGRSGTAGRGAHSSNRPRARRAVTEEDAEARLFLEAMSQTCVRPEAGTTASGGFGLDEQSNLSQKVAARRKAQTARAARTAAPAAATAAAPVSPSRTSGPATVAATSGDGPVQGQVAADSEADAFLLAMRQVRPLPGRGRAVAPPVVAQTPPPAADTSLQDFLEGKLEFALSFTDEYLEGYVVGLDPLIMGKLRAGSLSPEAHMDLHGLNVQQAFESLRGFLRGSWYKGLRTVLVVPGRGRNSPDGVSVLRGKLQTWLTQDPFKRVVLAFCTAQPHDGGPGSIYVLLRKFRKKGRICWERMPADADLF